MCVCAYTYIAMLNFNTIAQECPVCSGVGEYVHSNLLPIVSAVKSTMEPLEQMFFCCPTCCRHAYQPHMTAVSQPLLCLGISQASLDWNKAQYVHYIPANRRAYVEFIMSDNPCEISFGPGTLEVKTHLQNVCCCGDLFACRKEYRHLS